MVASRAYLAVGGSVLVDDLTVNGTSNYRAQLLRGSTGNDTCCRRRLEMNDYRPVGCAYLSI